ncbi:unnamed protein product [Caenorhabditis brenneri]
MPELRVCLKTATYKNAALNGSKKLSVTSKAHAYFQKNRETKKPIVTTSLLTSLARPDGVKMRSLVLIWTWTDQFRSMTIRQFQNYDELHVRDFDSQEVDKILIQNIRRVVNLNAYNMTIDEIVMSNFEMIRFYQTTFAEKDYNRFWKLWIRGTNPRLKKFDTREPSPYRPLDFESVLKGIKYKRMIGGWEDGIGLAGGYVIRRFNRDDAVVLIDNDEFKLITDCFYNN